jgi:hypothetical protein
MAAGRFANGVPREQAKVLYAVQEPTAASLFGRGITVADCVSLQTELVRGIETRSDDIA